MPPAVHGLDGSFAARALPTGSARYLSHLFAAPGARAGLLGSYALLAEWQALLDPATSNEAAHIKIAWWHEEIVRLTQGGARHPVSVYLASLPGAHPALFHPLLRAIEAVAQELGGVPLERPEELAAHADALIGAPLLLAAQLACPGLAATDARTGLSPLARAEYLARSLRDYRRDARAGRVPFVVSELLAAGVETRELVADHPAPALAGYLAGLRREAADDFERARRELAPPLRAPLRHQAVLAALGRAQLARVGTPRLAPLQDMLTAWNAARRAAR